MNKTEEKNLKVILAHPGRQHSFQLATALKHGNILFKYFTTVYDKETSILMKLVKRFINNENLKRANGRKCSSLRDNDVLQFCEIEGLITLVLSRIDKTQKIYTWFMDYTADRFGKKVAKYAIKHNTDIVIMYDYNSTKAFEIFKKRAPHIIRIMDVSTPARNFQKKIFEEDKEKSGTFASTLPKYSRKNKMKKFIKEIQDTDFFLTPSTFVNRSLLFNGIENDKMLNLPYGVDSKNFNFNIKSVSSSEQIVFIYAGQVAQHKGIYYLLEAFKRLDNKNVKLLVVGNLHGDQGLYEPYSNHCEFVGLVTHDRMAELYKQAHVLIQPSLADGFGLVALEAMSCGLPVILSDHTGASDIVVNGVNGFVVKSGDIDSIQEKVSWFISNKLQIPDMSIKARETAEVYSWERYYESAVDCIKSTKNSIQVCRK